MASIPPDIITEILCRLGVEDLLRYRCVSKGWCSLIDSPDFIKHHLSHSRLSLLLRDRCLCSVNFDSLETSQILNHSFEENDEYYTPKILGSCNGLVALRGDFFGEKLALWNPSTRKSIMLPVSKIESIFHRFTAYRLGYDPISDDYKLVRMAQLDRESYNDDDGVSEVNFYGLRADPPRTNDNDDSFGSQVNVYSLRTNSWRTIQEFPYYLRRSNGILASNALHWLVSKNPQLDTSFIAAFDLGTEEYRLLEAPDCLGAEFHTEFHELYMMKAMDFKYPQSFRSANVYDL
ncbi:hypothetical protein COLO4_22521 [Corchorus olitorius]|uniref:F-box domain-containing protein n=1 Tax=Corchorus olitorius TaxID=93759 RepID=A0A1R3ILJ4_9ROSI|nr:hypothetical protein COLO4_22521 [Corchorus olitorius]